MKSTNKFEQLAAAKNEASAGHVWTWGENQMLKFINWFLTGALAAVQNPNLDCGEHAKAFAVKTVKRELNARGIKFDDAIKDHNQVVGIVTQLFEYHRAILRRTLYLIEKECPDVAHPDPEIRMAANAGVMLRHLQIDDPDVVAWVERDKASQAAKRAFEMALARKNPARWKHPELDLWLILVWPLVTAEKWGYPTVHYLAYQKFPDSEARPMKSAENLGFHCKKTLGLKIKSKAGRPKNDIFDLQNPSPIQDFAINIDAHLPEYWNLKIRK